MRRPLTRGEKGLFVLPLLVFVFLTVAHWWPYASVEANCGPQPTFEAGFHESLCSLSKLFKRYPRAQHYFASWTWKGHEFAAHFSSVDDDWGMPDTLCVHGPDPDLIGFSYPWSWQNVSKEDINRAAEKHDSIQDLNSHRVN